MVKIEKLKFVEVSKEEMPNAGIGRNGAYKNFIQDFMKSGVSFAKVDGVDVTNIDAIYGGIHAYIARNPTIPVRVIRRKRENSAQVFVEKLV